jgi:aminobenzoyl-glutamate utilization protein B
MLCSITLSTEVTNTVADEPTAFVATYDQGEPVIGILDEFDVLLGRSRAANGMRNRTPTTTG